jgi:hypothetical protein
VRALGVVRQLTTSDSLARGRVDYLMLLACTFVSHISCFRKYDIYHTYKRNNIISKYSGFQAGVDTPEGKIFRLVRPVAPGNF